MPKGLSCELLLDIVRELVYPYDPKSCASGSSISRQGHPSQTYLRVGGQTKHNSNPVALHDGWGQSEATESNLEEMHAEDGCTEPRNKVKQVCEEFTTQLSLT